MPFATWWRGDPLPTLSPLPALTVQPSTDTALIARLMHLSEQVVENHLQNGNLPYIAFIAQTPAAYGWIARQKGAISGLQFAFTIPAYTGYLWSFLTFPQWRGQGIYPHLLQAIMQQEHLIDRFWIGYKPGNTASAHGINKAGFHLVCDIIISNNQISGLTLLDSSEQARSSADFFQLPIDVNT